MIKLYIYLVVKILINYCKLNNTFINKRLIKGISKKLVNVKKKLREEHRRKKHFKKQKHKFL